MPRSLPVLLVLVAVSVGCDNSGTESSAVTGPSVVLTSQTFTGTVPVGGSSTNTTFSVAVSGEVDITVTALGPPSNIILGLAIGIPSTIDSSCAAPVSPNDPHVQAATTPLVGSLTAGTYCVKLYDLGFMTAPISYTITVAHP